MAKTTESKFAEFLKNQKIDPRRLRVASRELEKLRPEDRALRLKKRVSKAAEAGKGEASPKPRSGRPVTLPLLDRALSGKSVGGPEKTRLLRAVNRLLEQKKKDPVDIRALF
jgi:hypothetical protein